MGLFGALFMGALNVVSVISRTLTPILEELLKPVLERLARALTAFFRELGLLEPGMETAELGDKALQAGMDEIHPIKPEDYDLYSEYIEAIKTYTPNPEISLKIPQEDKERKGLELESGLALEKFGQPMLDIVIYACKHPDHFEDGRWLQTLGKVINDDNAILPLLANYISGKKQSIEDDDKAFAALARVEKDISPDAPDSVILETINERVGTGH